MSDMNLIVVIEIKDNTKFAFMVDDNVPIYKYNLRDANEDEIKQYWIKRPIFDGFKNTKIEVK